MSDPKNPHGEVPPSQSRDEHEPAIVPDRLGHEPHDGPALDGGSGLAADDPAAEEEVGGGD